MLKPFSCVRSDDDFRYVLVTDRDPRSLPFTIRDSATGWAQRAPAPHNERKTRRARRQSSGNGGAVGGANGGPGTWSPVGLDRSIVRRFFPGEDTKKTPETRDRIRLRLHVIEGGSGFCLFAVRQIESERTLSETEKMQILKARLTRDFSGSTWATLNRQGGGGAVSVD